MLNTNNTFRATTPAAPAARQGAQTTVSTPATKAAPKTTDTFHTGNASQVGKTEALNNARQAAEEHSSKLLGAAFQHAVAKQQARAGH